MVAKEVAMMVAMSTAAVADTVLVAEETALWLQPR